MDFVLALHSHLPWVLHHGRWPHGTDWLCEAALDTYLPLVEELQQLAAADVTAPVTVGITPVLANQLAHPSFGAEMQHFLAERLRACQITPDELRRTGEEELIPLVAFWQERWERMERLLDGNHGDILSPFRRLQEDGRIEIIGSAATHGYLPLLGREESVRLQLHVGYSEHRRIFGEAPRGCWLPECAYRSRGTGPRGAHRAGIDEHLGAVGFGYFFADAHLAAAGTPLGGYHDIPLGAERFDAERHDPPAGSVQRVIRSPYGAYRVSAGMTPTVRAFIRDPRSSLQVWSRHEGYPGDEWYLEFHKIRWPGGLKLWRVTGPNADLGDKRRYEPERAEERSQEHGRNFAGLLERIADDQRETGEVIVAPFDTELFGHWWFEGVKFLGTTYRELQRRPQVRATTASGHLEQRPQSAAIRLAEGSWGSGGDHRMWFNDETRWTWERLWPLEDRFWETARDSVGREETRPIVAQAARALLLAQSSDWQFIISTGAAADYAERRFSEHCSGLEGLLGAMAPDATAEAKRRGLEVANELAERDNPFPAVLDSVIATLDATAEPSAR